MALHRVCQCGNFMTIDESCVGTIVCCDRCGKVIETINGLQSANQVDFSLPSSELPHDESATFATPAINSLNSDNSQVNQVGLETEKNPPEKNTNPNTTATNNNNQTEIAKNYKQGSKDIIDQLDLSSLPSNPNDTTVNFRNDSDVGNKSGTKKSDDFVIVQDANNKVDWRQMLADNRKTTEKSATSSGIKSSPKLHKNTDTAEATNEGETVLTISGGKNLTDVPARKNNSDSGSRHSSGSHNYSDPGRFGTTINLDLTKRVMRTINQSDSGASEGTSSNIGGYGVHRILKQHQRGGMGRIMIAYDQHLKRDVALKELHKEVIDDISIVQRFVGEAEITAQLEHPGIVPIHWLGLDKDGLPYYTMKLIRGKTYQDAIKEYHRNPSKQELKSLVRRLVSICKTIGFAHERGVIHRDLKPANIMLGEHGETLVMDWGLAKPLQQNQLKKQNENDHEDEYNSGMTKITGEVRTELTMVGAIVGTPAFMSPEQASPEDNIVGTHSDIYSLGTILYYLLVGHTAFSGRSTREVLAKVRAATPTKPSELKLNVPAGLEAICMKAMAKNPKDRYQTTKEMDEDLCRWLDDIPVKAMHITPIQTMFRWFSRHWLAAISIPLAIISIIMLAIFVIRYDRTYNVVASEEARRVALEDEVDLTEQSCVEFRGGNNIDAKKEERLTGGNMIICTLKQDSTVNSGLLEILAPSGSAWNLSKRRKLKFSVFEYRSGSILPLDNLKIRLGRGSAYFEYQPSKATTDWWEQRRHGNWCTYIVPIDGSPDWPKTISDNPQFETIDWIEFHFESRHDDKFQIDDIMFLKSE